MLKGECERWNKQAPSLVENAELPFIEGKQALSR
jgi:hypothetical protein